MISMSRDARALQLFSELVDYPHPELAKSVSELRKLVARESPEAAMLLGEFAAFAERVSFRTLEDVYSATFDLNATCHPYIGYHIFGEDYRRSVLLVELKAKYREFKFDCGAELPDHLGVMLRFMAVCTDEGLVSDMARSAILPTLKPMVLAAPEVAAVAEGEEPPPEAFDVGREYRQVLKALQGFLEARYGAAEELEIIPLPEQSRLVS